MCLEKDLLERVGVYMSRSFIGSLGLDVRYSNWNVRDGSKEGSVQFGVLWGGRHIKQFEERYHFDPGEVKDTADIGIGYFAFLKQLLTERTRGLKWEVDSNRALTLIVTRSGKPEDVKIVEEETVSA